MDERVNYFVDDSTVEVDDETWAAIEVGIRDVEEGRVVSAEEVRRRVAQWTSDLSTPKPR